MEGTKKNRRTEKAGKHAETAAKSAKKAERNLPGGNHKRVDEREADTRYTVTRLEYIRLKLQRGDKKRIAEKLGVHPEWVSQVIRGKGVSEPVLQEAEHIIRERKK